MWLAGHASCTVTLSSINTDHQEWNRYFFRFSNSCSSLVHYTGKSACGTVTVLGIARPAPVRAVVGEHM